MKEVVEMKEQLALKETENSALIKEIVHLSDKLKNVQTSQEKKIVSLRKETEVA